MSALLLAAVLGACWKTSVALAADLAVAVIFLGQKGKGWVHSTTTKTKNQMKGRFFLDVVVTQSTAIFQLFSGKDKTLLIRWDTFLVLDLLLDIFDGLLKTKRKRVSRCTGERGREGTDGRLGLVGTYITWFYIEGNGFTRKSFYENLHRELIRIVICYV